MIKLHADDAVGVAAFSAAQSASVIAFNLLAAKSAVLDKAKRVEALERLFLAWPMLCRAMGELEQAAPASAAHGYEQAARLREFALRHEASKATSASVADAG